VTAADAWAEGTWLAGRPKGPGEPQITLTVKGMPDAGWRGLGKIGSSAGTGHRAGGAARYHAATAKETCAQECVAARPGVA